MASTTPKKTTTKTAAAKKANAAKTPVDPTKVIHGVQPYILSEKEEYMSTQQEEHFRKILLAWRAELMEEVDRTVSHMQDDASNYPDPTDRATHEEEFSLELRTRDRERKLLKKITATLELIKYHDYGWCDQCGIEIGIRRLEIRPTASLCVDCKSLDEIKERQTMG